MITRFREDVEHTEEALSWTVDQAGALVFVTVALTVLANIDARMTIFVFTPLVIVVAGRRAGRNPHSALPRSCKQGDRPDHRDARRDVRVGPVDQGRRRPKSP